MTNLFVGLGGYATIQDAINNAEDGDHILVSAGVYSAFTVDRSVTIEGDGEVEIVGSFRSDNEIPLNTSVADFLKEAINYDPGSGAGIMIDADGVTLSNLHISSFLTGVSFDGADDLVLQNVDIKDTVIGVLKSGDGDSSGFRMWGGSITDSYEGISIDTDDGGPPIEVLGAPEGAGALIAESASSAFDDVIIDGVAFANITFKGIYANALSNAQLLNLVMTNVGQFGQGPGFGHPWEIGHHAGGIDINIASGFFDNIVISGFVMHDVGAGSLFNSDGAAITLRAEGDSEGPPEAIIGAASIAPPMGNVLIENGIVQGTALAYRLGTNGGDDEIWSNVSVQNVLVNGYLVGTLDNQSDQTLYVSGTSGPDLLDAAVTTDGQLVVYGVDGNDRIIGGTNDDLLDGGAGNDFIYTRKGVDTTNGGTGNDGVYYGAYFNQGDGPSGPGGSPSGSDSFTAAAAAPFFHFDDSDGGAGIDTFALQGNYYFSVLAQVTNFEALLLVSGFDPTFDFVGGREVIIEDGPPEIAPVFQPTPYFYNFIAPNSLVAAGTTFSVLAAGLQVGETLIFNGSAEHDGAYRFFTGHGLNIITGGDGSDGFMYGGNALGVMDRLDGGDGLDSLAFRGEYSGGNRIVLNNNSINSIEIVAVLSGHTNEYGGVIAPGGFDYDVTLADGNVRAGATLDIIAGGLRSDESLTFDGSNETNGAFRVIGGAGDDHLLGGALDDMLYGGLGADVMDGGDGRDTFVYRSAADSTASQTDWITLGAGDRIDLSAIGGGAQFSFIGGSAFHNVANELRLFLSDGHWVAAGDVNGDGVADLVINISSGEHNAVLIGADAFNL